MNKIKKILTIILCLIFIVTFFEGCKNSEEKNLKNGMFIEEEYSFPEEIAYLMDFKKLEDGNLAVLGKEGYGKTTDFEILKLRYFESSDLGKTWSEIKINTPEKIDNYFVSYESGKITSKGEIVVNAIYYTPKDIENINEERKSLLENKSQEEEINKDYKNNWIIINKNGTKRDVTNYEDGFKYSGLKLDNKGNGYFLSLDNKEIIKINLETKDIENTFKFNDEKVDNFTILDNFLIVNDSHEVFKYNIENGQKEKIDILTEKINENLDYYISSQKEKTMYMVGTNGLYRYALGNEVLEKLIEGNTSILGSSKDFLKGFIEIGDNNFLGIFSNNENSQMLLEHFYFSKDETKTPKKKITIYSLYEDNTLKEAISKYKKEHNDIYINYEIGIDEEKYKSDKEDAIRALNVEIMAGNGPDIIQLDGLEVDLYIEKGFLEDISNIVSKLNDECFTNILNNLNNNKTYVVPIKFSVPIELNKVGENIETLQAFTKKIKSIKESFNGDIISPINAEELLYYFYGGYENGLLNEDKSLNKESLKEYLENIKIIYDETKNFHSEELINNHNKEIKKYEEYLENNKEQEDLSKSFAKKYAHGDDYNSVFYKNTSAIKIAYIYSFENFAEIYANKEKYNVKVTAWHGNGKGVVVPQILIGLSSKSNNKEISKDFIKELFSEKYQSLNKYEGIPINKNTLKNELSDKRNFGTNLTIKDDLENVIGFKSRELSDKEIDDVISLIESYNGWGIIDMMIIDNTIEEMTAYVEGKASMEDTISKIEDKLKIYLSE